MKSQRKLGVAISYLNIALNMVVSVFFTPFLVSSLGQAEYGVYRLVYSFAGQLAIMTFGIAALTARNVAYFDALGDKKKKENFLFMALIISVVLSIITILIGVVLYGITDNIFFNSLSADEIALAKKLVILLTLNFSVTILNDFFMGIVNGHERFGVENFAKTVRLTLRIATLILLLNLGCKSVYIVATDLMLSLGVLLFNIFYGKLKLNEKAKFHYFDKLLFKTSVLYSSAMLIQAVINQVNQNLDGLILGIMTNAETVAVYSIALTIYTTFGSITTIAHSVFVPYVTKMIAKSATSKEITDFVARIGRIQFIIAGAIVVGFAVFGKEFLSLWLGADYIPAYYVTLIIIIPMTIPLIQSACQSVLDAKLKRMGRSIILGVIALLNLIISVVLVKRVGYIGAAYGTAISSIIGYGIIINIYYKKSVDIDVLSMFRQIFHKLLPCMLVLFAVFYPLRNITLLSGGWVSLLIKIMIYVLAYATLIYFAGMNKQEKNMINFFKKKRSIKNV